MIYPPQIEQKIGFDKIRELLKKECTSTLGEEYVEKIQFISDQEKLLRMLHQTDEFVQILQKGETFPSSGFIDIRNFLFRIRPEGSFLPEEDAHKLRMALQTIQSCFVFFDKRKEEYPYLAFLAKLGAYDFHLIKHFDQILDENGKVKANASPELAQIRKRLNAEHGRIRKVLDQIIRESKNKGYTPDDVSLTIRGGRMVIPVLAEHKRKIKGFVHDESATGQTVYLEPAEVLEINNELRELELAEKREITRILCSLADKVRPHIQVLDKATTFLGMVDFIRAKAKFAIKTRALLPTVENRPLIQWYDARHPLLEISLQQQGKAIVAQNFHLKEGERILVISGPNAGGKSVSLKTVGLLQYSLQCGLLVPLAEKSIMGIFHKIMADIGDEQSLENDLSTYSSHLTNMKQFLLHADKETLFLIDEFGTGTEPGFGGAIAEAILVELNKLKPFGIITTHYANLKKLAEDTPGLVNGAMRFDMEHLEPMYQLEIGKPGSSFALEIARKIGLPGPVVNLAREKVGVEQVQLDKLLANVEKERMRFRSENDRLALEKAQFEEKYKVFQEQKEELDTKKKEILNKAKEEAQRLLKEANQKIETTIREIKEQKADKESTKLLRQDLQGLGEKLKTEKIRKKSVHDEYEPGEGPVEVGSYVKIKGQEVYGKVMGFKGKDAEVMVGELKTNVKLNRLEKVFRKEAEKTIKSKASNIQLHKKQANFSSNLDLRGKRGEEAFTELSRFVDEAILLNAGSLRIIHGKGDGILRKIVRDFLRKQKHVKNIRDEHADMGGDGVTLLEID